MLLVFLKSVASFTGDLSHLTCPAIMLSGVSILEYLSHYLDHPDYFAAITMPNDPIGDLNFIS